ncbi:ABC transporter ATP-binding protein uup-1 [Aulographum hederae CBS 113979]|uniref:ABC transporter ATP-binding protein uup-1 n=1 Tax=Aulographum hederae CBS 113979 TaxID=1176131 RepID=A0A6G1GVD3_9PEZI|nr:ABC transporter ATP-binding protein uup-1 [Aulographum hederae CBS 113979]
MPRKGKEASTTDPSALTVSSQQSRYQLDAVDAPTSKEVLVKDLSIAIGQKEILAHVELFLKEGGHYVLVGRNGVGKSTLLKAIADGLIPGIPWSIRILLLGQTRTVEDDMQNLRLEEETVLQHVIRSDVTRERLIRESAILSEALEGSNDPLKAVKAYRKVSHDRLERRTAEARQIAERRSGARGKDARKQLIKLEEQVETSLASLDFAVDDVNPDQMSEETQAAANMLADVLSSLELMDASTTETKARSVLLGLGFSADSIDKPASNLSGGWRTRCDIASALCQTADILLLDEPTNFLDLPSIIWLQNYIITLPSTTTVLTITHDRSFADAVADDLLIMRNQAIEKFRGNLSLYESERAANAKYLGRMKEAQDRQKKHMEQTVENSIRAAKRTGDDKKLKQAASRQKKLDERMGMEVSAKGTRFKLNRDLAGYHLTNRAEIDVPKFDPPVRLVVPTQPSDLRFPGALVSLENVSFAYPKSKSRVILNDITLTIHPGDRIGFAGLNGSGKTTLVSLITGAGESQEATLNPTKGTITRHPRLKAGRFSQRAVEDLEALGSQEPQLTALAHLMQISASKLEEKDARASLSGLGLQGQIASDVPIAALSGGQKVRLALAKVLVEPPHLLVLDEVTTHLDADTILALATALRAYEGALLVVTHDRFFMRCVVEGENPYVLAKRAGVDDEEDDSSDEDEDEAMRRKGTVYRMFRGGLRRLEGGMEQYEGIAERASSKLGK